jgi:cell division septum initiation protein DivIVA
LSEEIKKRIEELQKQVADWKEERERLMAQAQQMQQRDAQLLNAIVAANGAIIELTKLIELVEKGSEK